MYYELTDRFEVSADANATWKFFTTAENLSKITPPWLGFTVRTTGENGGAVVIQNDTILDYTVKALGLPVHWRTRIIDFTPQKQFIDLQIKGPYSLWHHQHTFEPSASGVVCTDRVIYKIPAGPIGQMLHSLSIRRQLNEIFHFRREAIGKLLGSVKPVQDVTIRTL